LPISQKKKKKKGKRERRKIRPGAFCIYVSAWFFTPEKKKRKDKEHITATPIAAVVRIVLPCIIISNTIEKKKKRGEREGGEGKDEYLAAASHNLPIRSFSYYSISTTHEREGGEERKGKEKGEEK